MLAMSYSMSKTRRSSRFHIDLKGEQNYCNRLALTYSRIKIFSKFKKKNDYLNYLAKFIEQNFSKTHFDASESAKKVENFDEKCLTV
jgi:hypothetical protein